MRTSRRLVRFTVDHQGRPLYSRDGRQRLVELSHVSVGDAPRFAQQIRVLAAIGQRPPQEICSRSILRIIGRRPPIAHHISIRMFHQLAVDFLQRCSKSPLDLLSSQRAMSCPCMPLTSTFHKHHGQICREPALVAISPEVAGLEVEVH